MTVHFSPEALLFAFVIFAFTCGCYRLSWRFFQGLTPAELPSDLARSKTKLELSQWERGSGVTERLSTCHFESALVTAGGPFPFGPPADWSSQDRCAYIPLHFFVLFHSMHFLHANKLQMRWDFDSQVWFSDGRSKQLSMASVDCIWKYYILAPKSSTGKFISQICHIRNTFTSHSSHMK